MPIVYCYSDTTKNVLITSTYIHLKRVKFAKYTIDLSSVCPRILLSGPAGTTSIFLAVFAIYIYIISLIPADI